MIVDGLKIFLLKMNFIDTHTHLDGPEFDEDRDDVVARAKAAGVSRVFIPAISLGSLRTVLDTCSKYDGFAYPMIGLHPEEVKADWKEQLDKMKELLDGSLSSGSGKSKYIAVGEVGLDFYWSREFEAEQLLAFEEQVRWSVETRLPLMIHCRKAQNEMVKILRKYQGSLPGGVFHCFTGNGHEAAELLSFGNFCLGIGGVLTFKKSNLPETLPENVPLNRIVLETDSPYMAPVPMRGKRNESAFVAYVLEKLAECYGVGKQTVADATNANVERVFNLKL